MNVDTVQTGAPVTGQVIIVPDPEIHEATDPMSELQSLLIVAQVLARLWQLLRWISVEMRRRRNHRDRARGRAFDPVTSPAPR